jgi:hypothetical protein
MTNDLPIEELIEREKQLEKDVARLGENGMSAQAGIKQADLDEVRAKLRELRDKI